MYLSPCFWKPECWNCLIVAVVVALARLKRVQESWLLARRKRTPENYDPAPAGEYLLLIIGQVCPAIWDHLAPPAALPAKPTQQARWGNSSGSTTVRASESGWQVAGCLRYVTVSRGPTSTSTSTPPERLGDVFWPAFYWLRTPSWKWGSVENVVEISWWSQNTLSPQWEKRVIVLTSSFETDEII